MGYHFKSKVLTENPETGKPWTTKSLECFLGGHDFQVAHDLFVAGEIDKYRCTKCGEVLEK